MGVRDMFGIFNWIYTKRKIINISVQLRGYVKTIFLFDVMSNYRVGSRQKLKAISMKKCIFFDGGVVSQHCQHLVLYLFDLTNDYFHGNLCPLRLLICVMLCTIFVYNMPVPHKFSERSGSMFFVLFNASSNF